MRHIFGAVVPLAALALSTAAFAQEKDGRQASAVPQVASKPGFALRSMPIGTSFSPIPSQGRGRAMIVGGWAPNSRTMVGVGLFSVPKSATTDMQEVRVNPMKDPTGKTSRVAAVGLSFAF
jgi:hypothetical protein